MKRTAIVTAAIGAALSVASVAPAHAEVAPNTHVYRITTCSSYGSVATCRQKEIVESPGSYRWHARHLILSGGGVIDRSAWGGWHVEQMQ